MSIYYIDGVVKEVSFGLYILNMMLVVMCWMWVGGSVVVKWKVSEIQRRSSGRCQAMP